MSERDSRLVPPEIREGASLMFVGEAPGTQEYKEGRPFVGSAGRVLVSMLEDAGLERNLCSFANVYPWYREGNPTPTPMEMVEGQELLNEAIIAAKPQVIVALGSVATARLVGHRSVDMWRGSLLHPPTEPCCGVQTVPDHDNPFKSGARGPGWRCTVCAWQWNRKKEPDTCPECGAPVVFRAAQPRPTKKEIHASNLGWMHHVLVTLHPANLIYTGFADRPLVVGDIRRAYISAKSQAISVGYSLMTDVRAESAIEYLSGEPPVCTLDYETNGRFGPVTALGFSRDHDSAVVLHPEEYRRALPQLGKVFDDPRRVWVAHNASYELLMAEKEGTPIAGKVFDTMHAAHFDRPDLPKGLDTVCSRIPELSYYNWKADFKEHRFPDLYYYNALDCAYTHALFLFYSVKLKKSGQWDHFWNVLMPLVPILAKMESTGVRVDMELRDKLYAKYAQEVESWGNYWDKLSGGVNPASPKQLQEYFYGTLGLPPQYQRKGREKRITTNKAALVALAEKFPNVEGPTALLKWRAAAKIKSTYLDNVVGERIYPPYNISNTLTGRLSGGGAEDEHGENPNAFNFQNIPPDIRAMFIADEGDLGICSADWSQIEYRLSALLAGDAGLLDAYAKGDALFAETRNADDRFDIHQDVADRLGIPRKKAKRIVHGTNYGMQATTLAGHAGISVAEARTYLQLFKVQYPILERWRNRVVHIAKKQGYITNPFTRRLVFPVKSGKVDAPKVIAAGPQSTAADMMLIAITRVHEAGLKLRWTVHDELGISMRTQEDVDTLRRAMEEPFPQLNGFWCPVDVGTGANWLEAKGD